jgi:hypothetical protein
MENARVSNSVKAAFDAVYVEMERMCFRDASDIREYKPFVWGKVMSLHHVTHLDLEECAQVMLEILAKGCYHFYRTQHEELQRYCGTLEGPKRSSRAKMSTWMNTHINNKYNSYMTSFFAPIHAYESGRVRTTEKDGTPGTMVLARHDVDGPDSPLASLSSDKFAHDPQCAAMWSHFKVRYKEAIEEALAVGTTSDLVRSAARDFGLDTQGFVQAVRGLFSAQEGVLC